MKQAPKIGARVRFTGHWARETGEAVTGTVTAIYRKRLYREADDDPRWDDDDFIPTAIGFKPESEWHAAVKVDAKPSWWPYPDTDQFAPAIGDLEPI